MMSPAWGRGKGTLAAVDQFAIQSRTLAEVGLSANDPKRTSENVAIAEI